jgi:hypothetical protein
VLKSCDILYAYSPIAIVNSMNREEITINVNKKNFKTFHEPIFCIRRIILLELFNHRYVYPKSSKLSCWLNPSNIKQKYCTLVLKNAWRSTDNMWQVGLARKFLFCFFRESFCEFQFSFAPKVCDEKLKISRKFSRKLRENSISLTNILSFSNESVS